MHVIGTDGETSHDIAIVPVIVLDDETVPETGLNEVPVTGLDFTCEVQQLSLSNTKSSSVNKVHKESLNEKKRTSSETRGSSWSEKRVSIDFFDREVEMQNQEDKEDEYEKQWKRHAHKKMGFPLREYLKIRELHPHHSTLKRRGAIDDVVIKPLYDIRYISKKIKRSRNYVSVKIMYLKSCC